MKMKEIHDWVKSHKPHTAGIIIALIAVITLSVVGATRALSPKPADTVSGKPTLTAEVPADTEKTPLNSEETKEAVAESTENTQASTETEAKATVTDAPKSASKPSDTASNNPAPNKPAEKAKTWVPEKGHYENTTEKVWVPNVVTVTDKDAWDETVNVGSEYVFADGFVTSDNATARAHAMDCILNGKDDGYSLRPIYKTVHHPAVTHTEDRGHYENKVTGKKWVVDVPGHYE